jgi:nickel transport system permease protein
MISFIIKRVLLLIPILFFVSIIVFCILRFGNNDPAMSYLRLSNIPPTDEALVQARKELNLDKPILSQYTDWFLKAIRLDFGKSYVTKQPVINDILYYLPATLQLTFVSLLLTIMISISLGVLSARHPNSIIDNIGRCISFFGVSMPNFFLGFLLVYFFSVTFHLLPPMGKTGIQHFILPSITLSLMSIAILIRFVRTNMIEEMNHRYILYARARGVTEGRITWRHQFKSGMIPIITVLGMHLGELLGGAVVVETIFAWPGVGRYAVSAIYNRDFPVIECFLLIMTIIFVLCNLIVDILYAWIDPRVRYSTGGSK